MAAVTESIEFATSVLVLPQRQTALVAKQAAQLAILSGNRFRMGIGTGWNTVEYEALGVPFAERGKRQAEQVKLMRALWESDSFSFPGDYHTVTQASILPRPQRPIPIWFGGIAPALLKRCAELGDGWFPLGGPNAASAHALATMRRHREAAGLSLDGFGVQAQAQARGGTPERWKKHAQRWRGLGCTHLAIVTQSMGHERIEQHLETARQYFDAVGELP
jgi:probable F420-dependent oxidoreductase